MTIELKSNEPEIDPTDPKKSIESTWDRHRFKIKMVNPANKRKYNVIVVGTGLAGASAAATLAELGYNVLNFCFQDSARRAHSIAAQGGINAAKNYQNDGDSVYRLFYDTVKGGDFRSREANVYRLAQVSVNIIDQAVAQGVPFAREYGGLLANRSFGGALVSRTFYARGQTGQQLLLGAYQAHARMVEAGKITMYPRTEMLDLVKVDGEAKGIVIRDLLTGEIRSYAADCVVLATGGYSNVFFLSTNAMGCNVTAAWRASKRGALFANPCYTQIHPTCIPQAGDYQSKLTLMSESLRNDGRVWVPKTKELAEQVRNRTLDPKDIPEDQRDYYLERIYPTFGNLVPRDVASRAAKRMCDAGLGVAPTKRGYGVFLDFKDAIERDGEDAVRARYGNLFEMYERITDDNPYKTPMRIYPAPHYTMGGLWVDYNLMSNVKGLFVIGEANFSDHGANRLGASALMQGLADGYFILPYTIGHYLATVEGGASTSENPAFQEVEKEAKARLQKILDVKGTKACDDFHRELGYLMLDKVGMARDKEGLEHTIRRIREIREDFWQNVSVPGKADGINPALEKAARVADFLEFAEVMVHDALERTESCGGHFRTESQTEEGEAQRMDDEYCHVAAWEYKGTEEKPICHKESLSFQYVLPSQRSYK
ncbi:MAG: fumarate reductase/succinate dehydrogenase flavoprotein subunit [Myxococcota bacterium]|nr:fumarate reductase/succinate dehydrogenase flavoprotein subunit [Myxococcota bacterium]